MTGYTVRRYEQLETFPETIEQELRPAVWELRQTDLKENNSIDCASSKLVTVNLSVKVGLYFRRRQALCRAFTRISNARESVRFNKIAIQGTPQMAVD